MEKKYEFFLLKPIVREEYIFTTESDVIAYFFPSKE